MKKLDSRDVFGSIGFIPKQAAQAWSEARRIKIPKNYSRVSRILVCGMGGSAIGPHAVRSIFYDKIDAPMQIINSYNLPAYVDENTLVLLSSYSGTTEEVISCAREARAKRAKIMVIAAGGVLAEMAKKYSWPMYEFTPKWNPCGQPRLGLGYAIFGTLALLSRAGLARVSESEGEAMIRALARQAKRFAANGTNPAKNLARQLKGKQVILIGSEFLEGNMHIAANQINETSKQFATYFLIPEINHHLLEGLSFPERPKRDMRFVFFESKKYHPQVQRRYALTRQIIERNKIKTLTYRFSETAKLAQASEALMLGAYLSFYLGIMNGKDPSDIPWVNFLKKKLSN